MLPRKQIVCLIALSCRPCMSADLDDSPVVRRSRASRLRAPQHGRVASVPRGLLLRFHEEAPQECDIGLAASMGMRLAGGTANLSSRTGGNSLPRARAVWYLPSSPR